VAQGADLGLKLGLAAFLAALLAALLPALSLLFALLAVASAAVLRGDARRAGPGALRTATLALALVALGFLALVAAANLARGTQAGSAPPASAVWLGLAAEVSVAAGLYLAPAHLAADRSRTLLGLAFGASIALSGLVAYLSQGPADQLEAAIGAKGVPFILFAWGYATILGRLRAQARAPPAPGQG
jgi:hypothetical protein